MEETRGTFQFGVTDRALLAFEWLRIRAEERETITDSDLFDAADHFQIWHRDEIDCDDDQALEASYADHHRIYELLERLLTA